MPSSDRIVILRTWNLTGKLLESLPLGLRYKQCSEDTTQHEECEDLHDVIEPGRRVRLGRIAFGTEWSKDSLGNDSADFARSGRQTVRGGAVASWETFTRYDEGCGVLSAVMSGRRGRLTCCIGSEIEEELGKDI